MKVVSKQLPEKISFERVRAIKAADRHTDTRRLARRLVTPEQLQSENAMLDHCNQFQILNLAETMRFFRRHTHLANS